MANDRSQSTHGDTLAVPKRWREVIEDAKSQVASWLQWMRDEMRAESNAIRHFD
jgi:hypothetical protein